MYDSLSPIENQILSALKSKYRKLILNGTPKDIAKLAVSDAVSKSFHLETTGLETWNHYFGLQAKHGRDTRVNGNGKSKPKKEPTVKSSQLSIDDFAEKPEVGKSQLDLMAEFTQASQKLQAEFEQRLQILLAEEKKTKEAESKKHQLQLFSGKNIHVRRTQKTGSGDVCVYRVCSRGGGEIHFCQFETLTRANNCASKIQAYIDQLHG